jgi:hypothetical protein
MAAPDSDALELFDILEQLILPLCDLWELVMLNVRHGSSGFRPLAGAR